MVPKAKGRSAGDATQSRPRYIKLKTPSDTIAYVQTLINRLREEGLETELECLGKITNLLNTWLNAYKINLEFIEMKELKEQIAELRRQVDNANRVKDA